MYENLVSKNCKKELFITHHVIIYYIYTCNFKSFIMNTKLTLNLNKEIIQEAKTYAKNNSVSLSKLIENYLNSLTRNSKKQATVSPLVESLTGIIPSEYDEKNDYRNYIDQKYL